MLNTFESPPQQRGVLFSDHDLDERSVVVIGDIHGCAHALRDLLTCIIHTGCQVVFVGDLVDRGDDFKSVLSIVHSMCTNPEKWGISSAICLMGNHERMILDAHFASEFNLWIDNGGRLEDIEFITETDRWDWFKNLPLYYEHPVRVVWNDEPFKLLVTHGSIEPGIPLKEQDPFTLFWGRKIQGFSREHITVHGHTICRDREPLEFDTPTGTVLRIDTGSYALGTISGVAFREVEE